MSALLGSAHCSWWTKCAACRFNLLLRRARPGANRRCLKSIVAYGRGGSIGWVWALGVRGGLGSEDGRVVGAGRDEFDVEGVD